MDTKDSKTKKITLTAMLGAISSILMLIEFPLPFAPSFMEMDLSDFPIILGGYIMGPLWGFMIVVIKILLNFVFNGTDTAGVGEFANMLYSAAYMLPAVFVYRKLKTKTGAAISLILATIFVSCVAIAVNLYITFPVYANLFHMDMEAIVSMGSTVNPFVKDEISLMLFSIFPFNIIKYSIVSVITFLLYKKVKGVLHI